MVQMQKDKLLIADDLSFYYFKNVQVLFPDGNPMTGNYGPN